MRNLSQNLRDLRGYRKISPLEASTLVWLNGCSGLSGQDKNAAGSADVGSAVSIILTGRGATATAGCSRSSARSGGLR